MTRASTSGATRRPATLAWLTALVVACAFPTGRAGAQEARAVAIPRAVTFAPAPQYPDSLRASRTEGFVFAEVRVEANGRPDTRTFRVLESSHPLFDRALRAALAAWRFDAPGLAYVAARFVTSETEERERLGARAREFSVQGRQIEPVVIAIP